MGKHSLSSIYLECLSEATFLFLNPYLVSLGVSESQVRKSSIGGEEMLALLNKTKEGKTSNVETNNFILILLLNNSDLRKGLHLQPVRDECIAQNKFDIKGLHVQKKERK